MTVALLLLLLLLAGRLEAGRRTRVRCSHCEWPMWCEQSVTHRCFLLSRRQMPVRLYGLCRRCSGRKIRARRCAASYDTLIVCTQHRTLRPSSGMKWVVPQPNTTPSATLLLCLGVASSLTIFSVFGTPIGSERTVRKYANRTKRINHTIVHISPAFDSAVCTGNVAPATAAAEAPATQTHACIAKLCDNRLVTGEAAEQTQTLESTYGHKLTLETTTLQTHIRRTHKHKHTQTPPPERTANKDGTCGAHNV